MSSVQTAESATTAKVVRSSQPTSSLETRATIDPKRTVHATGEDRDAVWVAVVGGPDDDIMDGGAKKLANRYAFDGRPDVGVDRTVGPFADDGNVTHPIDLGAAPMTGALTTAEEYRRMAAEANLRKGKKRFVAFLLVRPMTTA
jgi:hypothetical protein